MKICFEGINGSGKNTQIELLRKYLLKMGKSISVVIENDRDPYRNLVKEYFNTRKGGKDIAITDFLEQQDFDKETLKKIRDVSEKFKTKNTDNINFNATLLLGLGRSVVQKFIETLHDDYVLMDRWYYTNMVYQSEGGLDPEVIKQINFAFGVRAPDTTFLLDVDGATAASRIKYRKRERKGIRDLFLENLEKKRRHYLEIAEMEKMIIIYASKPINDIQKMIRKYVDVKS